MVKNEKKCYKRMKMLMAPRSICKVLRNHFSIVKSKNKKKGE